MVLGCARSSVLLKVAGLMIFISFLLHAIGFASPFWSQRTNGNEGLWEICQNGECILPSDSPVLQNEAWFKAVRACESIGVVTAALAIILVLVLLFSAKQSTNLDILICAAVFSYLTGIFVLIGLVVYATRGSITFEAAFGTDFLPGFAFYMIVLATTGWIVAGVILSCDLDTKLETSRQLKEKALSKPTNCDCVVITSAPPAPASS